MGKVLTLEPNKTEALIKQVLALYEAGELDQSMELILKGLGDDPDEAQLINCAAMILHKAGKTPVAVSLAERAIALQPNRPEPLSVAGLCYQRMWKLDTAMAYFRRALSLLKREQKEKYALSLNNIGSVYIDDGKFSEAEKWLRDSISTHHDPLANHNLGLSLLGQRKWREGWERYSSSVGTQFRRNWKYRQPDEPTWEGQYDQKVIVFGEQGIGDEICFASMIPDAANDAKIIVDCDKRLLGLFTRSFPQCKVYGTRNEKTLNWDKEDRDFDASISMGELARFYRNEDSEFPGTPYLVPCPERTAAWKAYFKTLGKPVIGIAWTGGVWLNASKYRNAPLELWKPVFDSVDAHFVNLEYKPTSVGEFPVHTYPWATLTKDYDDTASLVAACDQVITMQTAVAHTAAALGVPTSVMVPTQSQWKYGKFETMPWYSCMKVYQQRTDWTEVLERIARDLRGDRRALAVV